MPVTLDTPVTFGEDTLNEVKIIRFRHDSVRQRILVRWQFGNTVDDNWVGSRYRPAGGVLRARFKDADYTALVAEEPGEGETTYQAVKRALYEKLQADGLVPAGSIS